MEMMETEDKVKEYIVVEAGKILLGRDGDAKMRLLREGELALREDAEVFEFGNHRAVTANGLTSPVEELAENGFLTLGVREAYGVLPEETYKAVVKGVEMIAWNEEERYCSRCGILLMRATEISKRCPECGAEYFPRLSPAIVVLVKRGEEALLVHARNFRRPEMMALVAGFVETGESLEECVRREIKEETDLEVRNIRYVGSQSWPFPHQLMLGFTAEYAGGEVKFADGELSAGAFFTRDNVPEIPTPPSLSRRIIDMWLDGKL